MNPLLFAAIVILVPSYLLLNVFPGIRTTRYACAVAVAMFLFILLMYLFGFDADLSERLERGGSHATLMVVICLVARWGVRRRGRKQSE